MSLTACNAYALIFGLHSFVWLMHRLIIYVFYLYQDVLIMCMVTATWSAPFSQHHRLLKNQLLPQHNSVIPLLPVLISRIPVVHKIFLFIIQSLQLLTFASSYDNDDNPLLFLSFMSWNCFIRPQLISPSPIIHKKKRSKKSIIAAAAIWILGMYFTPIYHKNVKNEFHFL